EILGLAPEVTAQIVERTEGNPLFAVQLVGELVNNGQLQPTERGFTLVGESIGGLPADLRELRAARVQRLASTFGDDTHDAIMLALELAATLGQEVDGGEWRALCALAKTEVPADLVRHMVDRRLAFDIRSGTVSGGWAFGHGMFREALVDRARRGE